MIAGKFIVHNYGHGGAGITLSWDAPPRCAKSSSNILLLRMMEMRQYSALA